MSWGCLENVLKTSSRRLENVLKTYDQDEYVDLDEDVLKTSSEDVWVRRIYSSWSRRLEDVLKTSSEDEDERRLQDVFKTSSSRRMFAGSELGLYHQKLDGRVSSWVAKKLKTFSPVPISLKYFVKTCSYGHGFPIFLSFIEHRVFAVLSL